MTYVMQHETWMNLTSVSGKVRSRQLRSVDAALKHYHKVRTDAALRDLRGALQQWKMYKGFDGTRAQPAWRTSIRNRKKAVETLDMQLFQVPDASAQAVLDDLAELPYYGIELWADQEAREVLRQAREGALTELFLNRSLDFKKSGLVLVARSMMKKKDAVVSNASAAAKAAAAAATAAERSKAEKAIWDMLNSLLGDYPQQVAQEVLKLIGELVPGLVADLIASMAHYLSIAKSGAQFAYNTGQAIKKEYRWVQVRQHRDALGAGDPFAAAIALKRMLERERNQNARLAAIYGAETLVKSASVAADAAAYGAPTVSAITTPLAGMASALSRLSLQIFLLARDVNERRKVNKILADPNRIRLSNDIFDKCPILGCWFIACSNTSDIINFLTEDIGQVGWKLDVEVMKRKHIEPMEGYARDLISNHRMEVSGLGMSKGAVSPTTGTLSTMHLQYKNRLVNGVKQKIPFTDYAKAHDMSGSVSREELKRRIAARP